MDRFIQNAPVTLSFAADGTIAGGVTVTVKDSAGVTVKTGAGTVSGATATFALVLADTAVLDVYTVTWDYSIGSNAYKSLTEYEVVGRYYFTVAEAQAFDSSIASLPTQDVIKARVASEEQIEETLRMSFVPRGRRENLATGNVRSLVLSQQRPRRMVSVSVQTGPTQTSFTQAQLDDLLLLPTGEVLSKSGAAPWSQVAAPSFYSRSGQNLTVFYEHGYDQPPESVKRAALLLARNKLVPQGQSAAGVRQLSVEGYSVTYSGESITGLPEADQLLEPYRARVSLA